MPYAEGLLGIGQKMNAGDKLSLAMPKLLAALSRAASL